MFNLVKNNGICPCSNISIQIIKMINQYMALNNLPTVKISISLCEVARQRMNQRKFYGVMDTKQCSTKSWRGCCYNENVRCMLDRPKILTDFNGDGYEFLEFGVRSYKEAVLNILKRNSLEILQMWQSIGADYSEEYNTTVIWLSKSSDFRRSAGCEDIQQREEVFNQKYFKVQIRKLRPSVFPNMELKSFIFI